MNGNVSVRRGDSGDLVAAIMNVPLTAGDRLVTTDSARAEVQFDFANLVRLGPATEVRFSDLEYHRYQIQVATGTISFRILRDSDAQIEISTPSVSVHPLRKGIYRVSVKPDGASEITVRAGGDAEIAGPSGSEKLPSGKTMQARGSASDPEFQVIGGIPEDEFDRWSASRDHLFENARSPGYVSRDITGSEDLDANGRWANDGSYGNVWVPQVAPGWAPYQCGRWTWVDFYGWTWVGCESWGWAPYHYGRWYYGGLGWAWWPGPVYAPYFWRPALVGFFGFGAPGIGIGFGFGSVGWVPLAPFERFHAWYGAGFYGGARGNFNVIGGTNVAAIYRNARVGNGVTAMNAGEFGRAGVSSATLVRPSVNELTHAGMVRGGLPVAPSRESTQFTNRAASTAGMPRTAENAHFYSRSAPSQTSHVPFEQQRQSINQAAQRSAGNTAGASGAQTGGWRQATPAAQSRGTGLGTSNSGTSSSNGGWQKFDPSTRATSASSAGSTAGQGNRGMSESPQSRTPGASPQQPVRISPSIVQNRGNSGARGGSTGSAPRTNGGGGSHPSASGGTSRGGSSSSGHSGGRR
jgi:FecR protein